MATCKKCEATIAWAETEATAKKPPRKIPLDCDDNGDLLNLPSEGNIVFTGQNSASGLPIVRVLPKGKGNRRSHFATCKFAGEFRKKR